MSLQDEVKQALEEASKIVTAYGEILVKAEKSAEPGIHYYPEALLPYSQLRIRAALELLLLVPYSEDRRNSLGVADLKLNHFLSNDEYSVMTQQLGGLSKALKEFYPPRDLTALEMERLRQTVGTGVTEEGRARLGNIMDQVNLKNKATVERHQDIKSASALFMEQGKSMLVWAQILFRSGFLKD